MYVIDGDLFFEADSIKIDSILQANGPRYLKSIDVLKKDARSHHTNNDVVVVTFAYSQKIKLKRKLLRKVKKSFVDNYVSSSQHILTDSKDPVLYIDNVLIHHTEAKEKIKALTPKSVYFIDYNDKSVSAEHYGQNAKNGLARIWTVSK